MPILCNLTCINDDIRLYKLEQMAMVVNDKERELRYIGNRIETTSVWLKCKYM